MFDLSKIPGFEKPPDLHALKACTDIYKIAGLKTMNMKKDVAGALKKLLDDRRELLQLCIKMFCILFLTHQNNDSVFESECLFLFRKVTGKSIDEILKVNNGKRKEYRKEE